MGRWFLDEEQKQVDNYGVVKEDDRIDGVKEGKVTVYDKNGIFCTKRIVDNGELISEKHSLFK